MRRARQCAALVAAVLAAGCATLPQFEATGTLDADERTLIELAARESPASDPSWGELPVGSSPRAGRTVVVLALDEMRGTPAYLSVGELLNIPPALLARTRSVAVVVDGPAVEVVALGRFSRFWLIPLLRIGRWRMEGTWVVRSADGLWQADLGRAGVLRLRSMPGAPPAWPSRTEVERLIEQGEGVYGGPAVMLVLRDGPLDLAGALRVAMQRGWAHATLDTTALVAQFGDESGARAALATVRLFWSVLAEALRLPDGGRPGSERRERVVTVGPLAVGASQLLSSALEVLEEGEER